MSLKNIIKEQSFALSKEEKEQFIDGAQGFNSSKDALDEINFLLSTKFPDGLLFEKDNEDIWLYRILFFDNDNKDEDKLDLDNLGSHWVADPLIMDDTSFIDNLLYSNDRDWESMMIVLILKTSSDSIDMKETLSNRMNFPNEQEITLDSIFDIKELYVVNKENFNENNPLTSSNIKKLI